MKILLFFITILGLFSCSEDIKKYPIACDVTVVKYKDGQLFSSKREIQNHYSEYTSEQFSKLLTTNAIYTTHEGVWQIVARYDCVDFKK